MATSRLDYFKLGTAHPATYGCEDVPEDPVHLQLRNAQPHGDQEGTHLLEPTFLLTVMPFNTWQIVKRRIKERWPGLKAVPDSNIRLLHKSVELRNGNMVDDYSMDGGTQDRPIQLQYLIIDQGDCSRHKGERNMGLYVDAQVPCTQGLRERINAALAALLSGIQPRLTEEGTGATYMMRDTANRHNLAVFKPKDEEAFAPQNPRGYVGQENTVGLRQGVLSSQQAAREVAAYLLDHEKFAGVPETTLVHGKHPKFVPVNDKVVWKIGAFQAFVETKDTSGNFAPQVFSASDVHSIGILDVRIVNLDRNDGNLLVRAGKGSSRWELIPIDHGLSLPDRLEVYTDDIVWMSWPQARKPFGERELSYIKNLNGARDARLIDKCLGVRRECLRLLEVTTKLLQIGADHGLTLYEIGTILYREDRGSDSDGPVQLSKLEQIISSCLDAALAVAGHGAGVTSVSSTLSGLDLQTSRPACRQVMSRQTSGGNDGLPVASFCPSSPFSSPLSIAAVSNGVDMEPPQLMLDGLSESDEPESPDRIQGGPPLDGAVLAKAVEAQVPSSTRQTPRPVRGSYKHGTARLRQRTSAALVASHREGEGGDASSSIFARPNLGGSEWSPELEKAFRRHLELELTEFIRKRFPPGGRSSSPRNDALGEKSLTPVDTSLASALPIVMPDDVSTDSTTPKNDAEEVDAELPKRESAPTAKYVPPHMRRAKADTDDLRVQFTADAEVNTAPAAEDRKPEDTGEDDLKSLARASAGARARYVPPFLRRQQAAAAAEAAALEKDVAGSTTAASSSDTAVSSFEGLPADESGGNKRYGYCVAQGQRRSMEDAVDAIPNLDSSTELFAVYDGHSGTQAVEFVRRRLPRLLGSQKGFRDADPDILHKAIEDAFRLTDEELLAELKKEVCTSSQQEMQLSAGSVGCVALVRGSRIHVANLGDCRAILCEKGEFNCLTLDHRTDANPAESERLQKLGVEVTSDGYLHGRLAVSRAWGDWNFSREEKCIGLLCQPELSVAEVNDSTEFLLLACDGIFEKMTSKEAGQIVRRRLRATGDPKAAAENLILHASKRDVSDNLSVMVVLFKAPEVETGRAAPRLFGGFKLQQESVQTAAVPA
eukprot:TRINITY_DN36865_c0_g1_i1.p1 TRINITY_DN36865_c0_g1~~TRINITY_DN36865_c0_g1_i1.p1  ORF type:complete len:1123 (-),score=232.61 TRINITY_DN36865_c0_g1_i1:29-3364(-)